MKRTIDIRERIAVRAYFAWLAGSTAGAKADWLKAEPIEIALAERRVAAASKAAATRTAKAFSPNSGKTVPVEMLVASPKRRPAVQPTAH